MRIADLLLSIASWLEDPDENEAILLAEHNDECLKVVSESCVKASQLLKEAAHKVDEIEPSEPIISKQAVTELASIAEAFDLSEDDRLRKQASVIDELLLTIAANPEVFASLKSAQQKKIDMIKKKYKEPRELSRKLDKLSESEKAIKDSPAYKEYRVLENSLSTRYCPDHPGTSLQRINDLEWQCDLDKKIYNYDSGFSLNNGSKVPGSSVANQSQVPLQEANNIFDTRESRLYGYNKD